MGLLQTCHKHLIVESSHVLFRSILLSALAAPALRLFGARIGPHARIHTPLQLHNTRFCHLTIGHHCHIGRDVFLDLSHAIEIGDQVTIAMRVTLITHMDVGDSPVKEADYPSTGGPITIHGGAYIGAGATILHGVEIGENAVIGAGALVIDHVPPRSVVVGVPGRVIKTLEMASPHPHPEANSDGSNAARESVRAPAS